MPAPSHSPLPDLRHLSQREREQLLLAQAVEAGRVQRVPSKMNPDFSRYLSAERRKRSSNRARTLAETGRSARASFDLKVAEQADRAGEEGNVPFKEGTWKDEWRPLNDD